MFDPSRKIQAYGRKLLPWLFFLPGCGYIDKALADPVIELGKPETYCVVYCYIRVPFTIANYGSTSRIGRVFCDFDAEVSAKLPIYNGETRTKGIQASPIGVFKNEQGKIQGDVEISTGIIKEYFVGAKVKSVHCHL